MTLECKMKYHRLSLDNQTKLSTQMLYDTHRAGRERERERQRETERDRERESEKRQSQTILYVTRLVMLR